ncbi:MAG TPA: hypothetical protein VL053_06860, partial [Arachidicoccus sp.]|nr:hypothetical protein [Arachidicoccus sp.]
MKKLTTTLVLALLALVTFAQQNPVKWSTAAEKAGTNQYKVTIIATFSEPWHIYSQNTPDGGPVPTSFSFAKNPLV